MRISVLSALVLALASDATLASTWFGKAAYNKWHETELERWLSDHNVPYPTPADRKDLENLVKDNWNDKIVTPYNSWDTGRLQSYLSAKGKASKNQAQADRDSLISSVKSSWYETEDQASESYSNVKDWLFDSWTESQLKSFCDRNGIPVPQPRARDSLLKAVRENYQSAADKLGEKAYYPGDWIYESWSQSDLKAWLDERGYPAPQPTNRDKLVAEVRRNSRIASDSMRDSMASASMSAVGVQQSLTDALIDAWSDSQIKEFCDKNNIKVPQGSNRNELIAIARKHRAKLTGDNVKASAASAYGAATSSAGNQYAKASDYSTGQGNAVVDAVMGYVDWVKVQLGLSPGDARAKASSAASAASSSASSLSSLASKSSSSAYAAASKSGSKNAQKAADAAAESASKAAHRAQEAAQKATDYAKEEL